MENAEAILAKSGETIIQTSLWRSADGLTVNVRALPKVEDFIRSLGTGERTDVQVIGRHWSLTKLDEMNNKKLFVYDLSNNLGVITSDNQKVSFRLNRPGYPLIEMNEEDVIERDRYGRQIKNRGNEILNLSFLRFVGISDAEGVTFVSKGVYSKEEVDSLSQQIELALKKFYQEYMKPYKVVISVSTMPIPGGSF